MASRSHLIRSRSAARLLHVSFLFVSQIKNLMMWHRLSIGLPDAKPSTAAKVSKCRRQAVGALT